DKDILEKALEQARVGRLHILQKMLEVLPAPRTQLSKYAPKIISFEIPTDKIGDVIGKGGKIINKIIDETGVKIDITEEGKVMVASTDIKLAELAKNKILAITLEPEVGFQYQCHITRLYDFGAIAEIAPGKEGMIHISKLGATRVKKITDVLNVGDEVIVEIIKIDPVKDRIELKLVQKLDKKEE
ncbi:MAG TPA: S1 RNA-binding domain-containing protein, partial [Clostridia bacterium]